MVHASKKRTSKTASKSRNSEQFEAMTPFMARVAKGNIQRHNLYSICVKASAAKCFEFNLAIEQIAKSKSTFFAMSSLRGICEDLIVLRYVGKLPAADREKLIKALSTAELAGRSKLQDEFFSTIRPQQPVLRFKDVDNIIASHEARARAIWNSHGWPGLQKGAMPQIRQLAEKQGMHQLAVLYDYLYRLTSAAVHFNVQSLFRSGWGPNFNQFVFSTKNFEAYYTSYCSLYGAFLFCLYFEFFGSVLRPTPKERAVVDKIRENVLFTERWPEMVTFEEMNQAPPANGKTMQVVVSAFQAVSRRRLISRGVNYRDKRSSERRTVAKLLKVILKKKAVQKKQRKPQDVR